MAVTISVIEERILRHLAAGEPAHTAAIGFAVGSEAGLVDLGCARLNRAGMVRIHRGPRTDRRGRRWPTLWEITDAGLERLDRLGAA